MRALCQLSYRATWSSFDISPCLIRFVPESARNNGGTTRHAPFDAHCPSRESTLATKCHRGGKNHGPTGTRTQGLSLTMRALCQLSYRATWSSLILSPCLIRFVPESARNNGGATRHALFDARCPSREPTLSHQMSQGRKNRGPTGTRTQGLSLTVRALCQLSYRATWSSFDISPCLIRFVPESARNNGGTTRHAPFDAHCPSRESTLATKCHRGGKNHGPTGTRTQGLSLTMRALCQLSYRATWSSLILSPCLIRFVPESARNNGGTKRHAPFDFLPFQNLLSNILNLISYSHPSLILNHLISVLLTLDLFIVY